MHLVDGLSSGLGLGAGGIAEMEKAIMNAINSKETMDGEGQVLLMLDGLDFLLAATDFEVLGVLDMIGELREVRFLSAYRLHALAQRRRRHTARLLHDHRYSRRPAPPSIGHHAPRNIPPGFRDGLGAPGEIDHERKGTRYRAGHGCQWRSQG